jgi:hypothetical protein
MSFKNLKKSRSSAINKLVEAAETYAGGNNNNQDDEFWRCGRDKANNGYAVIRFLPAPEGEDLPWIRFWDHGFQGPSGQWYIEKSLTSIGKDDPVGEVNKDLWNSGDESDKELARKQKRRLHYVANILVVEDKANPENEGRVMLYKFGKKIFDKITEAMQPEFEDETPLNPFDFWEGANFKVKVREVEGWINYDKSEFAKPDALKDGDDEALEKIYGELQSLAKFTDESTYKSYDELKQRLDKVLGNAPTRSTAEETDLSKAAAAPQPKTADAPAPKSEPEPSADGDDEDVMSYFENMAND